ncbi:hypothetical protein KFL_001800160 [Klebsormidium nitens]|uniref:F-box domain-containing protein n=1 Tax=Klebsormidium nitens TaxID=105231 RepID=A0A1Y1I7X6_KLENI|nr:hypothetical protein KFL_001800160 [Klebsormidium nitens]|eukprot:GAQ84208.1 hypothetical protein KFL_001800160 [Klebsormidium nitens]
MEKLDEGMFGILLKFVRPEEACRLGATSRTFLRWTEQSALWKGWCEEAFPSITTSPAKKTVRVLCERVETDSERARAYKRLYAAPQGSQRASQSVPAEPPSAPSWSGLVSQLQDSVLLVDVFAGEEAVLACSIDGERMTPAAGDRYWSVKVEATHIPAAEKWLRVAFEEDRNTRVNASMISRLLAGEPPGEPLHAPAERHDILAFSCKMMRKSDGGEVRALIDKAALFTVEVWPRRWEESDFQRYLLELTLISR